MGPIQFFFQGTFNQSPTSAANAGNEGDHNQPGRACLMGKAELKSNRQVACSMRFHAPLSLSASHAPYAIPLLPPPSMKPTTNVRNMPHIHGGQSRAAAKPAVMRLASYAY